MLALLAAGPAFARASACEALARSTDARVRIDSARDVAAADGLPVHCQLTGMIGARTGADGKPYGVGFELRLPVDWSGRLLFQGGGGLDGEVKPALGNVPWAGARTLPGALARHYAVVSMDGGHRGDGAAFAADQQARRDFAEAAAPQVTRAAKALAQRYYGRAPERSYFMGCSNGGREAMMAAERDPQAFDGIVAANPGFRLSASALEEVWETAVFNAAAPRDAAGMPILAQALSDADLKLVAGAVLAKCDGADGLVDGLAFNHSCRFDPGVLVCRPGSAAASCLPQAKVDLLRLVFAGAHGADGGALYASWPFDAGIAAPAWRRQKLGTAPGAQANAGNAVRGSEAWYSVMLRAPVPTPLPSPAAVLASATSEAAGASAALFQVAPDGMARFAARGGKLLLLQGMADPVFSADDLVTWYQRAQGASPAPAPWLRLFLSPGIGHCGGGPGLDNVDPLATIEAWVEQGSAPAQLLATGASLPGVARPLCAYPAYAQYDGKGDVALATSFTCVASTGSAP